MGPDPSHAHGAASLAPLAQAGEVGGGQEGHHTIFAPRRQADFLASLALNGNVRLACCAASVSAQTAYRARRASPAFARAWDAALLSTRDHAEQVLADRAINGVEEEVFYHGEEVARRRRNSDRLLLAHLARPDRMAERPELGQALPQLDAQIEALRRGEALVEAPRANLPQDRVPCVSDSWDSPRCSNSLLDGLPDVEVRLAAMNAARPMGEPLPEDMAEAQDWDEVEAIEASQLAAYEAEVEQWWTVTSEDQMLAMMDAQWAREDGEGRGEGEWEVVGD
ncbi:hypothetical protein GRI58_00950 [Porphyrobacter algicida]|uniref:Uncharacterized protein n=1 Tax=Qipengyuania algicida TaxID=1836209 RepID=A0A845AD30_9SPHN|nr:hypothetical protein [Qipengyuania algicida]MXP27387.1 hypothetical protein [Qipengyuania algicida]